MFQEEDLLPISALQHLAFCERQWALIHLEGLWSENVLTAEGRHLHARADQPSTEVRGNIRTARGLRLRSLRLGLSGIADVVEFHRLAKSENPPAGTSLPGVSGLWRPFPVEYKRGKPKAEPCDEIQLCAQALCLEEMLNCAVPSGALFYGKHQKRYDRNFDEALRTLTESWIDKLHDRTRDRETPAPVYEKKCDNCSLFGLCLPKILHSSHSAARYCENSVRDNLKDTGNNLP